MVPSRGPVKLPLHCNGESWFFKIDKAFETQLFQQYSKLEYHLHKEPCQCILSIDSLFLIPLIASIDADSKKAHSNKPFQFYQ